MATVTQNGRTRSQDSTSIAEIKDKAKESVQKEARGASAIALLRAAGVQSIKARASEESGNLKDALGAITRAASLARMFMESSEFKAEAQSGGHGVLHKQFRDFIAVRSTLFIRSESDDHSFRLQHDGGDIQDRTKTLEKKLREIEDSSTRQVIRRLECIAVLTDVQQLRGVTGR
jgi:ubiquitin carboxyl-terminal hydrolase 8